MHHRALLLHVPAIAVLCSLAGCVDEDAARARCAEIPAPEWQMDPKPEKAETPSDALVFYGHGIHERSFSVSRDGLTDPTLVLHRSDDGRSFLGAIWSEGGGSTTPIELRASGDHVSGSRAGKVVDVRVARGTTTDVTGNYGGGFVTLHVRHEASADCAYHDDAAPAEEGMTCASMRYAVQIPKAMKDLPEAEQAAMLLVAFYR